MRKFLAILLACILAGTAFAESDQSIRQKMIEESLASYPGNCPCPYNRDRAGRSCGKRSAYTKPGGYSPLCYPSDVTQEMVDNYRRLHGER